jgi:hypothetical protein
MITIFCDFSQFLAKKLAFFLNTNVMINFFSKFSFVSSQKRQFFRKIFRRKYLKNHNIGSRLTRLAKLDWATLWSTFFTSSYGHPEQGDQMS